MYIAHLIKVFEPETMVEIYINNNFIEKLSVKEILTPNKHGLTKSLYIDTENNCIVKVENDTLKIYL